MHGIALEGLHISSTMPPDPKREPMAEQHSIWRIVVDSFQASSSAHRSRIALDRRRLLQMAERCGWRKQFQFNLVHRLQPGSKAAITP